MTDESWSALILVLLGFSLACAARRLVACRPTDLGAGRAGADARGRCGRGGGRRPRGRRRRDRAADGARRGARPRRWRPGHRAGLRARRPAAATGRLLGPGRPGAPRRCLDRCTRADRDLRVTRRRLARGHRGGAGREGPGPLPGAPGRRERRRTPAPPSGSSSAPSSACCGPPGVPASCCCSADLLPRVVVGEDPVDAGLVEAGDDVLVLLGIAHALGERERRGGRGTRCRGRGTPWATAHRAGSRSRTAWSSRASRTRGPTGRRRRWWSWLREWESSVHGATFVRRQRLGIGTCTQFLPHCRR